MERKIRNEKAGNIEFCHKKGVSSRSMFHLQGMMQLLVYQASFQMLRKNYYIRQKEKNDSFIHRLIADLIFNTSSMWLEVLTLLRKEICCSFFSPRPGDIRICGKPPVLLHLEPTRQVNHSVVYTHIPFFILLLHCTYISIILKVTVN